MNFLDIHTHLLHDLHTIAEWEYDTLLCGTNQMSLIVLIEVQTVNWTTDLLIHQHTLSTITKWNDGDSLTTDGNTGSQIIHVCIAHIRCDITVGPGIQDTGTIDTQQHTKTRLICSMIHMSKGVHTTLLVIVHLAKHTIYYTRSTCGGSNLTRIQHIEWKSIIRLVTTTICNRCTCLQSHLCGSLCTHHALLCECRNDVCNQRGIETIILHQEVCNLIVLKVPEHTLTQSTNCRIHGSTETHGDIVTRQHDLINLTIKLRLILLHPR